MTRKVNRKHLIDIEIGKCVAFDMRHADVEKKKPQPKEFIAKMISNSHCYDEFDNSVDSFFEQYESNNGSDINVQKTNKKTRKGKWVNGFEKAWKKQYNFAHEDYYDDLYTEEEKIAKERSVFGHKYDAKLVKVEETKAAKRHLKLNGIFCLREDVMRGYFFDFLHIVAHNNLSLREVQQVLQLSSSQLQAVKEIAAALGMVFVSHKTLIPYYTWGNKIRSRIKNVLTIASWGMLNKEAVIAFGNCPYLPRCIDTLGVNTKFKGGSREAALNRIADGIFKARRDKENLIEQEIGEILRCKYE